MAALHARYGSLLFLARTSMEGDLRVPWLRYLDGEASTASKLRRFMALPSRPSRSRYRSSATAALASGTTSWS
jgi:hypothetical protein